MTLIRSEEYKKKISKALTGRKLSQETKDKISKANKGRVVERTKEWSKNIGLAHKGKKHSKEHIEKMRKSKTGHKFGPCSEEKKLKISQANKGKKRTEEQKRKYSLCKIGIRTGDKNNLWKGGRMKFLPEMEQIRKSFEYKLWHKSCLQRDSFTCQNNNNHKTKLRVHHINNFADFPELRLAIDNGITLCDKCHIEFHVIYGRRNNTNEQLQEYLNNKNETI